MITFVPAFVAQRCRDWELELAEEMDRQGLDYRNLADRKQFKGNWIAEHPRPEATIADVVAHLEHARDIAGVDHIGLGGDYDGVDQLPVGLEDVSCYPALIDALLARRWSESDCGKLANGNILRVMRDAEIAAGLIQTRREPSVATMADLDGPSSESASPDTGVS
jgi:membrane dipeptidase